MIMTYLPDNECCPNCQSPIPEEANYCAFCGQKRYHTSDRSIWHLVLHSVGDFFHLDSKFFSTLKHLLFHPGWLTTEFLSGRRKRYFEPFKLFLFISFIYFLTSGVFKHYRDADSSDSIQTKNKIDTSFTSTKSKGVNLSFGAAYDKPIDIPDDSLKKLVRKEGLNSFVNRTYPNASWYTRFLVKRLIKTRIEGEESFNENLQKTIPKLIFILIPFFALILKLLFIRRKIHYYDHIIFSIHFLSFFFLLIWIKEFTELITQYISPLIYLILAFYLFISMRKVYRISYLKTSLKFILLCFSSLLIIGLFYMIAIMISLVMV